MRHVAFASQQLNVCCTDKRVFLCHNNLCEIMRPSVAAGFIQSGPLMRACGISPAEVQQNVGSWVELANQLGVNLGLSDTLWDNLQQRQASLPHIRHCYAHSGQISLHKAVNAFLQLITSSTELRAKVPDSCAQCLHATTICCP